MSSTDQSCQDIEWEINFPTETFLVLVRSEADSERDDVGVVEEAEGEDKVPESHPSWLGVYGAW